MNTVSRGVRMDVAYLLYQQYRKLISRPGHSPEVREEVEHALSLILNEKRTAGNPRYLFRNARRDARRIHRRRHVSLPVQEQFEVHEEIISGRVADPEQQLLAKERYRELAVIARDIGADAMGCLEDLLEEDSVENSMARLGLTSRRVRYMRALLRARLAERMYAEEAA